MIAHLTAIPSLCSTSLHLRADHFLPEVCGLTGACVWILSEEGALGDLLIISAALLLSNTHFQTGLCVKLRPELRSLRGEMLKDSELFIVKGCPFV